MSVQRWVRTPKGLLVVVMAALVALAVSGEGFAAVPVLAGGVGAAVIVDGLILRLSEGEWVFPDGALLTGLFVAMILSTLESWYAAAITSGVAIASKYVIRGRTANIFNPAALALVITFHALGTAQSWWGALPEISPAALVVLFATGLFITDRVNKAPAVVAFLGSYYLLATVSAVAGDPARVAELYRAPDLQAALFFAFFMVTDPPTSPAKRRDQVLYGVITATVAYAVFELVGAAYFLLAGLLVANAWEAWRRTRVRARRLSPAPA